MRKALTDKALEALKPQAKRYEVHDTYCPGLTVRVTPEGKKTFTVKYRYGLTQKRMSIGVYPRISLAAARQRAMDAMRKVDDGTDPSKLRRQADLRVDAIVTEFITRYAKPRNRKWMESERILLRELVAVFGQKDIREVTRADVLQIMDGAVERGAHYQANRILSNVRKLFNWLVERGIVERSPIVGLKAPTKEVSRDRVLDDEEIKAVLRACRNDTYPRPDYRDRAAAWQHRFDRCARHYSKRISRRHRLRAGVSLALFRAGNRRRQNAPDGRVHRLPAHCSWHQ